MAVQFDMRVSLGNVLTIVGMTVMLIGAWNNLTLDQARLAEKIAIIEATINAKTALRDRQIEAHEARLRAAEIGQASQSSDLRSIQAGISEIKATLDKLSRQ